VHGITDAEALPGVSVYHAGTSMRRGVLTVSGGRVLAVTGTGSDLATARERAYAGLERISFDGIQFRTDIASAAIATSS
jgi:phosphoribosylamine---glycine ligase